MPSSLQFALTLQYHFCTDWYFLFLFSILFLHFSVYARVVFYLLHLLFHAIFTPVDVSVNSVDRICCTGKLVCLAYT